MLLLVGSGPMAVEYAKVLCAQDVKFIVVSRGRDSADEFTKKTGVPVITGGLDAAISAGKVSNVRSAIVSVTIESLYEITIQLLKLGLRHILVEKPGFLYPHQLLPLYKAAKLTNANVYIAYNRRFYTSVQIARNIIKDDGGLTSFSFDFTEWAHEISSLNKAPGVKDYWIYGNSSHVIDLAFHIGGAPRNICAVQAGKGVLEWHPAGAIFVGCGETESGIPFSYHADWSAPGRWALEFCTHNYKIILRPLERLQIMRKGSVHIEEMTHDNSIENYDEKFKPGLYQQVASFLSPETATLLCTLEQMSILSNSISTISGYDPLSVLS